MRQIPDRHLFCEGFFLAIFEDLNLAWLAQEFAHAKTFKDCYMFF